MASTCKKCNTFLKNNAKYCPNCGERVEKDTKTLEQYLGEKNQERRTLFPPKKNERKAKLVTLNVGIMKLDSGSKLKRERGTWASISVSPEAKADEVLQLAITKHANLNQYFCALEPYVLLYPDQRICKYMPQNIELFTVEKYKLFLNLPYSKIQLFVCLQTQFDIAKEAAEDEDCESLAPTILKNKENIGNSANTECLQNLNNFEEDVLTGATSTRTVNQTLTEASLNVNEEYDLRKVNESQNMFSSIQMSMMQIPADQIYIPDDVSTSILCPICSTSINRDLIESHVNECLDDQRKSNRYLNADFPVQYLAERQDEYESNTDSEDDINISLQEISTEISRHGIDINGSAVNIMVFRGRCFLDFQNFFSKKWNLEKLRNRFNITFASEETFSMEDGIDEGGVSREFFTEALREVKEKFFVGCDDQKEPLLSLHAVVDGTMKMIGCLMGATICNYGPAPCFLARWVYDYIVGGMDLVLKSLPSEINDTREEFRPLVFAYNEIYKAQSNEDIRCVLTTDLGYKVLELTGYRGLPSKITMNDKTEILKSIILKKLESYTTILEQIVLGLGKFDLLVSIKEKPELYRLLFCKSSIFDWTYDLFIKKLKVNWSENRSTKKVLELEVYRIFLEMCDICFHQDGAAFIFASLMQYISGAESILPCGVPNLTLQFKHGCDAGCKCYPTANTCATSLTLPIHLSKNVEEVMELFSVAIKNSKKYGFGLA